MYDIPLVQKTISLSDVFGIKQMCLSSSQLMGVKRICILTFTSATKQLAKIKQITWKGDRQMFLFLT